MNPQAYLWHLVFDNDASYKVVAHRLQETGSFDDNYSSSFKCPDGKKRPALTVTYEIVMAVKNVRFGKKRLSFRVVRESVQDRSMEWYSPGRPEQPLIPEKPPIPAGPKFRSDPEAEKVPF